MSLPVVRDLLTDVNRLLVAGSRFANNDVRLKQRLKELQALADKAPVFKRLATDTEALLSASSDESHKHLLALSQLLYAVLYTQTEHLTREAISDFTAYAPQLSKLGRQYTHANLSAEMTLLQNQGQWRVERLEELEKAGVFADVRMFPSMFSALLIATSSTKRDEFVRSRMVRAGGRAFADFLLHATAHSTQGIISRMLALVTLDDPRARLLAEEYIIDGDVPESELLPVVLMALAGDETYQAMALAHLKDKKTKVSHAAFYCLMDMTSQVAQEACQAYLSQIKTYKSYSELALLIGHRLPRIYVDTLAIEVELSLKKILDTLYQEEHTTDEKQKKTHYYVQEVFNQTAPFLLPQLDLIKYTHKPELYDVYYEIICMKPLDGFSFNTCANYHELMFRHALSASDDDYTVFKQWIDPKSPRYVFKTDTFSNPLYGLMKLFEGYSIREFASTPAEVYDLLANVFLSERFSFSFYECLLPHLSSAKGYTELDPRWLSTFAYIFANTKRYLKYGVEKIAALLAGVVPREPALINQFFKQYLQEYAKSKHADELFPLFFLNLTPWLALISDENATKLLDACALLPESVLAYVQGNLKEPPARDPVTSLIVLVLNEEVCLYWPKHLRPQLLAFMKSLEKPLTLAVQQFNERLETLNQTTPSESDGLTEQDRALIKKILGAKACDYVYYFHANVPNVLSQLSQRIQSLAN